MPTRPRVSSLGLLGPGPDSDYGPGERSAWLDVNWQRHRRFVEVHGRQVNVVDIGSGPVLMFVHGLGASWQCWLENIPELARDHRVIAMDLPGFGASQMPEPDISIEYYARFLCALADELGVESAALVGNSMGGFIAAEMAIRYPERVQRLSLVSAAIFWQEYRRAKPLVSLARLTEARLGRRLANSADTVAVRPRLRELALLYGGIRYPHLIPHELGTELVRSASRTPGFLPALEALADFPLTEELPKIACPTLVVWGAHDALVAVNDSERIEQAIPDARRAVFERTGHVPMLERPARFNRVLREFLDEEPAQREGAAAERAEPASA
jgi:pimeloyl-ACP methyl ester carboxylesterase